MLSVLAGRYLARSSRGAASHAFRSRKGEPDIRQLGSATITARYQTRREKNKKFPHHQQFQHSAGPDRENQEPQQEIHAFDATHR